jgi:Domain of unknown function (DUF4253)
MKKSCRPFLSLSLLAAAALLLLGSNSQAKSGVASASTGSAVSRSTVSTAPGVVSRPSFSTAFGSASGPTVSTAPGVVNRPTVSTVPGTAKRPTRGATPRVTSEPAGSAVTLTPSEEELAKSIKFDRQVLILVKQQTHEHIYQLSGYDEDNYQIMADGIAAAAPEDKIDGILASLRRKLSPRDYMPFIVEMNAGFRRGRIGVLKGSDQYEILRVMHTDGDDYDITNQDVIDRLKEWEKTSPFDIIGAENDRVELEFKVLPKDLKAFVEEVYEFCPDALERGPGGAADLVNEIRKTKRLLLWWD